MSDFHCEVVEVTDVLAHENADSLEISMVYGTTPVITRIGQFKKGDMAIYVPLESVLPDDERFGFLHERDRQRLRAKKLRGVFSMGLLVEAPDGAVVGEDMTERLGITKYEPPEPGCNGAPGQPHEDSEPEPPMFHRYTDLEGYRRHPNVFKDGDPVVITEKIHGSSFRAAHDGKRLWVGSRRVVWKPESNNAFTNLARSCALEERLAQIPGMVIYGELFGPGVQDLTYGADRQDLTVFDVFDALTQRWLDDSEIRGLGFGTVPKLYEGPWHTGLLDMAEGQSTLANHVREGIVIRSARETFHPRLPGNRTMLKHVGQGYLLRKEKAAA